MSSRRRPPVNLAAARRSRSSFTGAVTRVKDKLMVIKGTAIVDYNTKSIDRILTSITNTETGFFQTIEEAQAFVQEEENPDDIQTKEDDAAEAFTTAIMDVRDLAEELLSLKSVHRGLTDFKADLASLQDLFNDRPDGITLVPCRH